MDCFLRITSNIFLFFFFSFFFSSNGVERNANCDWKTFKQKNISFSFAFQLLLSNCYNLIFINFSIYFRIFYPCCSSCPHWNSRERTNKPKKKCQDSTNFIKFSSFLKKSLNFSLDTSICFFFFFLNIDYFLYLFFIGCLLSYVRKAVYIIYLSMKRYNRLRAFSHYSIFVIRLEINVDRLSCIDWL